MSSPVIAPRWQEPFRASAFRLRFELGGEVHSSDEPIARFSQAFGRARSIARGIFQNGVQPLAIVGTWPDSRTDAFAPAKDGFAELSAMGFRLPPIAEWQAAPKDDLDDDSEPWTWRAFDIAGNWRACDVLIWAAISYELAIRPKAPVKSYFVDFETAVMLDVYDDRGMDVIAIRRESLLDLYRSRDGWLLDYDRPRMMGVFGKLLAE